MSKEKQRANSAESREITDPTADDIVRKALALKRPPEGWPWDNVRKNKKKSPRPPKDKGTT